MIIMGFLLLFAWFCGLLNVYVKFRNIRRGLEYLRSNHGVRTDDHFPGASPILADAFYVFAALSVFVAMAFFASLISTAT